MDESESATSLEMSLDFLECFQTFSSPIPWLILLAVLMTNTKYASIITF